MPKIGIATYDLLLSCPSDVDKFVKHYKINMLIRKGMMNMMLDKIYYTVSSLEGDYAYLRKDGDSPEELKCVARALLPSEISEGSRLVYEMMEYTVV